MIEDAYDTKVIVMNNRMMVEGRWLTSWIPVQVKYGVLVILPGRTVDPSYFVAGIRWSRCVQIHDLKRDLASLEVAGLFLETLQLVGRHLGGKVGDSFLFFLDLLSFLGDLSPTLSGQNKNADQQI